MDSLFIKKTLSLRGKEEGQKWLESIPLLIKGLEKSWSIKAEPPFELNINYVAPALRERQEVVLKICLPKDEEFKTEVEALKIFSGQGIVKLLDLDLEKGLMLLERCRPGISLSSLEDDDQATEAIAQTMKKIWKRIPSHHSFPTVTRWFERGFKWFYKNYPNGSEILPRKMVEEAEEIFKDLTDNPQQQFLLHGDLHHDNILSAQREPWLAIDPKGVIGEREYEIAAMLRNPYEKLLKVNNLKEVLTKRINILSKLLEFDEKRMIKWGFAQTVLSIIWNLENKAGRDRYWIKIAESLSNLLFNK